MDITELQKKIDYYRAQEAEVIARQQLATTDAQRSISLLTGSFTGKIMQI